MNRTKYLKLPCIYTIKCDGKVVAYQVIYLNDTIGTIGTQLFRAFEKLEAKQFLARIKGGDL